MIIISTKTDKDISWNWESNPVYYLDKMGEGFYNRAVSIDPFPCYTHDIDIVKEESLKCDVAWPLGMPCIISILDRESPARTNGHCDIEHQYQNGKNVGWGAAIVLWGKRTPPHPAMTRYLVNHEYGHAVAHAIAVQYYDDSIETLYKEYRKLRLTLEEAPKYYGGRTWHLSTNELFANDFRILVMKSEVEFWPHNQISRPEVTPKIIEFWKTHERPEQKLENVL